MQFIYKSLSGPDYMQPQRVEIQECFLRTGAEMDSWKYAWKVGHCSWPGVGVEVLRVEGRGLDMGSADSHVRAWVTDDNRKRCT